MRHLISQEVLWDPSPASLSFSHQTLADCLIVRSALAKNKTLEEFILDDHQLPFIRPAVRAFFFFLRVHQPDSFRKQVRQVLSNDEIAYHVKRLICESLAEIVPVEDDWRLLRTIFQNYPDLFRRLLVRMQEVVWFNFLKQHWLATAQASENWEDWLRQFCWKLSIWVNECPIEVIALWREAIASNWVDKQNLIGIILSGLENLKAWNTEGVQELLETLVQSSGSDKDFLGKLLSQWVQATNSGDDLLWRYITRDILPEDLHRWDLRDKLHSQPHDFHNDNFLEERLKQSDELLDLALSSLENWSNADRDLADSFLRDTSWRLRHSSSGIPHSLDSLTELLDGIENAFKHRSQLNDHWWQTNEPYLRNSQNRVFRYFVIQSYKQNIEGNLPGIEFQLQDEDLLEYEDLNYELGELMQVAYPYISESAQTTNQMVILRLSADLPSDMDESMISLWIAYENRKIYDLLIRIPFIFRTSETQSHINKWQNHFNYSQPSPDIHIQEISAIPPLSKEDLLKLSAKTLLRLLQHYEQYPARGFTSFDRDMSG
jgi:hypothetical protein